jgi:hypothetical protein
MGVGAKKIIALLVNLRDELGLPIVVVGTYKALRLLKSELSSARRLVEGGYFDLERPLSAEDEHWQSLCSAAWEFQWVRDPVDYSAGICTALYDVSQGITGIMLTTLATAQVAAIEDGSERVTEDLVRAVFAERLKPLHPAIRVLQSGDPILMDQFDDMYKNFWPSTEREGVDGATEACTPNPEPMNDDPAAAAIAAAETPKARRSKHSAPAADKAAAAKPLLTDEQIRKLVLTDSVKDLISVLDGR